MKTQSGEKGDKYYLFYQKEDGSLYAYTENKPYAIMFQLFRDMSLFYMKEMNLTSQNLHELHDEIPGGLLEPFYFRVNEQEMYIPVTKMEHTTVVHYSTQSTMVTLFMIAEKIPSKIFTDEMLDTLAIIKYTQASNTFKDGYDDNLFKPDYLQCFLKLYGKTMRERR